MTLRRLFVGSLLLFALSYWCWLRPCSNEAQAGSSSTTLASAESNGNHDLQEQRFRTSQCTHWKQVVVGRR